ncbi:SPFH/Band 7/PHB domain protein [Halorussus salilacus]|uniref:SPFH domain-containing protein n=1 Tax=Halorussus salilacus TaxID=2953750 RepID=UPI0020A20A62|nr:SPFH domain-containing protein [Halorussus salilacus]USZ67044.1 SPFH/Band 7/PHB domain protein [Halorussus salilacus]
MNGPFYELGRLTSGVDRSTVAVVGAVVVGLLVALPYLDAVTAVGLLVLGLAAALLSSAVEIVGAYEKRALTVFGEYRGLLQPGLNVVPPLVSATHTFDMRTQTLDVPPQEAITRDNSPVTADAVIFVRVMDAEKAYLEVEDYRDAVANLAQTTLRAVVGDMDLDDTLRQRAEINARIHEELDPQTDQWGVRVEAVEVQSVMPTPTVVSAMEQQTAAERRRRAMILEAQGERRSAIERAQGDKQSDIIRAQGEKRSQVLEAQGDAVSTVLRARSAESMGERAVLDKGMETLDAIGQGDSTTFVLPQELSSLVGRYGKHLTGSDVKVDGEVLESREFDAETEEWLGLDDVDEMLAELDDVDDETAITKQSQTE